MLGLVIVAFSGAGPGVVTQTYTRTDDGRLPGGPTGLDPGHDHRTTLQRSGWAEILFLHIRGRPPPRLDRGTAVGLCPVVVV